MTPMSRSSVSIGTLRVYGVIETRKIYAPYSCRITQNYCLLLLHSPFSKIYKSNNLSTILLHLWLRMVIPSRSCDSIVPGRVFNLEVPSDLIIDLQIKNFCLFSFGPTKLWSKWLSLANSSPDDPGRPSTSLVNFSEQNLFLQFSVDSFST